MSMNERISVKFGTYCFHVQISNPYFLSWRREKSAFSYLCLSLSVLGTYYACRNILNSTMKTEINCGNKLKMTTVFIIHIKFYIFRAKKIHIKGKVAPQEARCGPEGSRRFRFPDFMTFGTWRWWGCQPHAPATFIPRNCSWYSFSLGAESTPGPWCGWKEYVTEKSSDTTRNRSRDRPTSSAAP